MRTPARVLLALGASLTALALAAPARADASSWFSFSAGALGWKQKADSLSATSSLAFDVGAGTSPAAPFIVGGLFRVQPLLGHGTDLALLVRGATRGFQTGGFGVAVDAGGYARFWGVGSQGFEGGLTVGFPLGLQLTVQATAGTNDALSVGAVAGIDLLRLTVYRRAFLDRWPNPSPTAKGAVGSSGWGSALSF